MIKPTVFLSVPIDKYIKMRRADISSRKQNICRPFSPWFTQYPGSGGWQKRSQLYLWKITLHISYMQLIDTDLHVPVCPLLKLLLYKSMIMVRMIHNDIDAAQPIDVCNRFPAIPGKPHILSVKSCKIKGQEIRPLHYFIRPFRSLFFCIKIERTDLISVLSKLFFYLCQEIGCRFHIPMKCNDLHIPACFSISCYLKTVAADNSSGSYSDNIRMPLWKRFFPSGFRLCTPETFFLQLLYSVPHPPAIPHSCPSPR